MNAVMEVPRRLSILDDEPDVSRGLKRGLEKKGYDVVNVEPDTPELEAMVDKIMRVSDAALCDHALRGGMRVSFTGADVVAALTSRGFPSVLFTGVNPEERYAIRRQMALIPGFIHRDNDEGLRPRRVLRELLESVVEVRGGQPPARRRPRRTPVAVLGSRRAGLESLVELSVSGWPGADTIEIPSELLAEPWSERPHDAVGMTFMAWVNLHEEDEDKLFFRFEAEPLETERFLHASES